MVYSTVNVVEVLESWKSDLANNWMTRLRSNPDWMNDERTACIEWQKLNLIEALLELEKKDPT